MRNLLKMTPDVTLLENYINPDAVDVFEPNLWALSTDALIGAEIIDVVNHRDDRARETVIDTVILKLKNGEVIHILSSDNAVLYPEMWIRSGFLERPCDGTPGYVQEMLKQGKRHILNE